MPKTKTKRRKREPYGNQTPLLANGLSYRVSVRNADGGYGQRDIPVKDIWRALDEAVCLLRGHGLEDFDQQMVWDILVVMFGVDAAREMVEELT